MSLRAIHELRIHGLLARHVIGVPKALPVWPVRVTHHRRHKPRSANLEIPLCKPAKYLSGLMSRWMNSRGRSRGRRCRGRCGRRLHGQLAEVGEQHAGTGSIHELHHQEMLAGLFLLAGGAIVRTTLGWCSRAPFLASQEPGHIVAITGKASASTLMATYSLASSLKPEYRPHAALPSRRSRYRPARVKMS